MIDAALDDIAIEYRDRFRELLEQPAEDWRELRAELDSYLETIRVVASMARLLDIAVAERIVGVAQELLAQVQDLEPPAQRLVNAAVRYFTREDDDEEVTGVLGFDDDVQVFNAVCRALNRPELVIPMLRAPVEPE